MQLDDFRLLVEESDRWVSVHDAEGNFIYSNRMCEQIVGFRPEELVGKNPYSYFHPKDIEDIRHKSHHRAVDGSPLQEIEYRFLGKSGTYVWLQTITKIVKDNEGKVIRLLCYNNRLDDLTEIHPEIIKNKILLEEACNLTKVGYWEIDLRTMNPKWSKITYEIHDVPYGSFIDMTKAYLYYPEGAREIIISQMEVTLRTGQGYDLTLPFVSEKGDQKWVRAIGRTYMEENKVVGLFGVFQDVTQQREREEELKQVNKQLSIRNNQVEEFNRIISHNLRAPIGNISLLINFLRKEENEKERNKLLEMIETSSQSAFTTLNDLVEVVKHIQNDEVNLTAVRFKEIFEKVTAALDWDIQSKNVTIHTDFSESEQILYYNIYLESIFHNLLTNSLKYLSPDRELTIEVKTYQQHSKTKLEYKDNGIGIDLQRYGNKIFKLHQTFHPNVQGKGLGLYMTKSQIESLGGSIEVESEPGKGTSFIITFES